MPRGAKAGFPTYWTTYGQGPRAALMIHCTLAHSGSWGGVARHVSGALSMTAFDMPGHGRSGAWDAARGEFQGVTAAIAADFLETPTDVIGHSFGATVALRLAVERPDLVRSLVLIEPVFFAVALRERPDIKAQYEAMIHDFDTAMDAGDDWAAARAFTAIWGNGQPWDTVPVAEQRRLAGQMHLVAAGSAALHEDVGGMLDGEGLSRVVQPTLLIEGSRSPAIVAAIMDGLTARLPNATRSVIMGAGHMAPVTHAAQVSVEILRFLRV